MSTSESRSGVVLELAEEFLERYRQGQRPSLKEYIDRHPELAAEIKDVFPAMAMMENIALADESLAGEDEASRGRQPPDALQQLGDFRILREVGRGGMGIVYEAEQVSLGRHVALKALTRKMLLDATQKQRFEREAKAAAKLHHTNIVPVFGVGEHDGLPYYVMQFIQGLGLDEVLDELKRLQSGGTPTAGDGLRFARKDVSAVDVARSLLTGAFQGPSDPVASPAPGADAPGSPDSSATSKHSDSFTLSSSVTLPASRVKGKKATYWQSVAQIGVQVADALEYAHKQGILHRDIKPSNLLLDTRGTVWVADFGLARAETEDHLTHTGDIVGTLRYMPPEAFEGRSGKSSDIYSLGLTLYELLAMRPAFAEKDRRQLIKRVTTEEPPRLDKLNRAIPRDLVTIIHKAIDREPSRRYLTAGELAADLQRFLDDEPIRARRVSQSERLWRWCRHHPGVASLTAVLALILLGVTVSSLLAAEKERQGKQQEAALRKQAEDAQQQAERQRQRAEDNFAKARKAVDDYFTAVSESQLLRVSGMQPLRRDLLQSALAFYQGFLKERGDDPALRGDLAAAFLRMGKIRMELGESAASRKAYEGARELYEALTKAKAAPVEWRHGLAQCYFGLNRYDDAIALWEKLVQPEQPRFQKELADAYYVRGKELAAAGKVAEALQVAQHILAIREMLFRLNPNDPSAQRDLGFALFALGTRLHPIGRSAEALAMLRRAADYGETAFALGPQEIRNGAFLAHCQLYIAFYEHHLGHDKEALAAHRRGVEVCRKLARDNPAVPSTQSNLFRAYSFLAWYQRDRKQTEQYERTMRLAREVGERLPSDSPTDLYNLACFHALCATSLRPGNEKPTAEEQVEQKQEADLAMEALRKAIAAGFRDLDLLRRDTDLIALRGREDYKALEADLAARAAAAPSDKRKTSQQAAAQPQQAVQADPKNKSLRADLAASQHAIALIQLDLGKLDEAQKHLQQALAVREELVNQEPKNAQYQADLTASRFALGDIHWQSGRLAEGTKTWQRDLDALETAARRASDRSSFTGQLFAMRQMIAQHYARAGLWPEASVHFSRLLQREDASPYDHHCAACLALRAGDAAAYRRTCEAAVKRFGERSDVLSLIWTAWACVLADNAGTDPSTTIQWLRSRTGGSLTEGWQSHIFGLAHYRAGRFAEAVTQASKSDSENPNWPSHVMNWPVLALAHHRLGHVAEARRWLEKSSEEWRRLSPLLRSSDSLTVLPSTLDYFLKNWHDWLTFEILLREASVLIAGAPPLEEANDHAHRSLLYSQLGENEKAEAQWRAALQIAPREPALWLARGRAFAQLGQHDRADADFAKAATLTPDELNRFIEAGWWAVGPYPEDIKQPCPPEKEPDPSRPVAAVGSAEPLHWRPAPTDSDGRVHLRPIFNADHVSAYVLTYVYSPEERTATLLIGGDDRVRVWLNGRLVHQTNRKIDAPLELDSVPVTLKSGRNTLLCKVSPDTNTRDSYLRLRIGDNPLDRAILYAKLGLWDEAAVLFARYLDRHPSAGPSFYVRGAHAQLLVGNTAGYRRYVARMFERYDRDTPPYFWLLYAGGLLDGAVEAKRLVELAERSLERRNDPFNFHAAGIAYYRAGQFDKAIGRLEESLKNPAWQQAGGHASELGLALAHHRLGHAKGARQWFDKAEQWYEKAIGKALAIPYGQATLYNWADWPSFVALRREAHKLILGTDLPDDPRIKKLADGMRDWLKQRDKAIADYDVAVFWYGRQPYPWLARARRFIELKRNKEAEADLARIDRFTINDAEVWKERGRLYLELGQTDKAEADFRKEDVARRRQRGEWYARHRRWKEAAADFKAALQRDPPDKDLQWLHAAAALAAAGDREGYRWLCGELRKRFGDSSDYFVAERLAKVHLLLPDADTEAEWAGRLAERAVTRGKNNVWAPYFVFCKALADYRRGDSRAAAEGLEALLRRIASKEGLEESSLRIVSRMDLSACVHAVLAMALHRQGNAAAARGHLMEAAALLDRHLDDPTRFPLEANETYSHDWLIAWLLHREAQALIEGKKAEAKK